MDTKENVEVKNQPVIEEAAKESEKANDSTTEHISEKPGKSEDIIKSQTGIIQSLQKQIDELKKKPDARELLRQAIGGDKIEENIDPIKFVTSQVQELKTQLAEKEAIIAKDAYIDKLEGVADAEKRYLKEHIKATDDLDTVVTNELNSLRSVFQQITPQATDTRPKGQGNVSVDVTNAREILDHPEAFKKN